LSEHFREDVGVGVGDGVGEGVGVGVGPPFPPVGGTPAAAPERPEGLDAALLVLGGAVAVVALDEREVGATVGLPIVKVLGSVDVFAVAVSSHDVWLVPSVVFEFA
jgi:hypothetical protein